MGKDVCYHVLKHSGLQDGAVMYDPNLTKNVTYTDPRQFVKVVSSVLQDNQRWEIRSINGTQYKQLNPESILGLFCECVYRTKKHMNSTSIWTDKETGEQYIFAYSYGDDDYYGTAYEYVEKIEWI